jgi:hypothetical protein
MTSFAPAPAADRPTALVAALGELADATDSLTSAVERHDHASLVAANERAAALAARIGDLSAGLTDADRVRIDHARIGALRERIERAARRNAYLIERAWALDAATMRLLASLGRPAGDLPIHSYSPPPGPGYLDRQA